MSFGMPPPPIAGGGSPPPPGPAQRLAARAGVVVYEGGNSLFDEPVLVYLPGKGHRAGMTISSHVDRLLGRTGVLGNPGPLTINTDTGITDTGGTLVLTVRPRPKFFRHVYEVSGVANGQYSMSSVGNKELSLEANSEPFGFIKGDGFRGLSGRVLAVYDHDRRKVGELRVFPGNKSLFNQTVSHVLALDPGLGGELRRLLVAAPIVIEDMKRRQRASAA